VRNFENAISAGDLTHSGDEILTRHIANSRKRKLTVLDDKERQMHTLSKPAQHSPLKIDGAMAAVLAWEARRDAIEAGVVWTGDMPAAPKEPEPTRWEPGKALPGHLITTPVPVGPMGDLS
jgi:phage terminase large subunit-like protein